MSEPGLGDRALSRFSAGPVVLVTSVAAASGSRAAAAALACAGSEPDRAGLLIDLGGRAPRPSLISTGSARELEQRLAAHLPEAHVASRGATCHLGLDAGENGIEQIPAALPLVRDSVGIVHLPPHLLQPALEETRVGATGALLLADLSRDRALAALAVRDLLDRGLRAAVLKRPLSWLTARRALLGALSAEADALPPRVARVLGLGSDRR